MQLVSDFSQFEEGSSTRRVKSRSKACLHCRRRKMRCDGVKPSCFQCIRAERADECEYDDGITKTGTQVLYERLAMLEKRFRDLQATKRPTSARRDPSHSRENVSGNTTTNANLLRSNSAPERVNSRPGVNGNNIFERSASDVSTRQRSSRQNFPANAYGAETHGADAGVISLDDTFRTPHLQPSYIRSASLSSRSSPRSCCSTPSSSDLSYNEVTFHSSHAFSEGTQQMAATEVPYVASLRTENQTGYPYQGVTQMEMAVPPSDTHPETVIANSEFPNLFPPDLSSLNLDDGIPPAVIEHLIDNFLPHSQQVGLTLLASSLIDLSCISIASLSPSAACIANCFFFWGAHFSPVKVFNEHKEVFLHRALTTLPSLLSEPLSIAPEWRSTGFRSLTELGSHDAESSGGKPYNIMVAVAVSTMLATYFFAEGRALEGSYHANTASQLALCAGLHHTPDPRAWRSPFGSNARLHPTPTEYELASGSGDIPENAQSVQNASSGAELLPPPANLNHAIERHHLFWNVFVLDRAWSAAGRLPAPSSQWSAGAKGGGGIRIGDVLKDKDPRTAISTPWPQDFGLLLLENQVDNETSWTSSSTPVEDFLTGVDARPTRSILQLRAKSVALFEAASRIASFRGDKFDSCYDRLNASLQGNVSIFLKTVPQISAPDFRPPTFAKCAPYTARTLVQAAIIRLHFRLSLSAYEEDPILPILPRDTSPQTLIDGLLGYERVYSQHDMDGIPTLKNCTHAASVGMIQAAIEHCLSSAREIVRIASYLIQDDYAFLEPIIVPCWSLASEVLLRELRGRVIPASQPTDKTNLLLEVRVLETSLKNLGAVFPIANIEARKLTDALNHSATFRNVA